MEEKTLSECEELVLKVIWAGDSPMTMQEITENVNQQYSRNWQTKTVTTFLSRIVQKGYLTADRKGRQFYYYPTISEEDYRRHEVIRFTDSWTSGRADVFLAAFLSSRRLTEDEKKRIRSMIDEVE